MEDKFNYERLDRIALHITDKILEKYVHHYQESMDGFITIYLMTYKDVLDKLKSRDIPQLDVHGNKYNGPYSKR